jgi:Zn-dependent hydrolases, including glyoxylases
MFKRKMIALVGVLFCMATQASEAAIQQQNGFEIQKVSDNVYALVGDMTQRSPQNLGNNATYGVVILKTGVLLVDSGGSYLGAKAIAKTIQGLTNKPVKWVVNTGSQDHRWLGNSYFKKMGAVIYTSARAEKDQKAGCNQQSSMMEGFIGKKGIEGTKCVYADHTFKKHLALKLDGVKFELYHEGPAHTFGNSFVWMPSQKIAFVGDMVFNDRALGIQYTKDVNGWIATFNAMAAFKPKMVVPGHGHAGDLALAKRDTYDYLVFLRDKVRQLVANDGDMMAAGKIDQSRFNYLKQLDSIGAKNAMWIFETLQFE